MASKVLNVAYGMNGGDIGSMSERELLAAFFMADNNLPSVQVEHRAPIIANMRRLVNSLERMGWSARGQRKIRLETHLMVMQAITEKL